MSDVSGIEDEGQDKGVILVLSLVGQDPRRLGAQIFTFTFTFNTPADHLSKSKREGLNFRQM